MMRASAQRAPPRAPVAICASVATSGAQAPPACAPVLRKQRPSNVIAPAARDFRIAARVAFAVEARSSNERGRAVNARLDIRFDAMQSQRAECDADRQ